MCLAMESTLGSKQLHKMTETHDKTLSLYFMYILWVWPTINAELDASRAVFLSDDIEIYVCANTEIIATQNEAQSWGIKF